MTFKSDIRGLGGQKQVKDMLENHFTALMKIKPTINTRVPPAKHISKTGKRAKRPMSSMQGSGQMKLLNDLIENPQYEEQRETFK